MEKFSVSGRSPDYKLKAYLFPGNEEIENTTGLPFTLLIRLLQRALALHLPQRGRLSERFQPGVRSL